MPVQEVSAKVVERCFTASLRRAPETVHARAVYRVECEVGEHSQRPGRRSRVHNRRSIVRSNPVAPPTVGAPLFRAAEVTRNEATEHSSGREEVDRPGNQDGLVACVLPQPVAQLWVDMVVRSIQVQSRSRWWSRSNAMADAAAVQRTAVLSVWPRIIRCPQGVLEYQGLQPDSARIAARLRSQLSAPGPFSCGGSAANHDEA